MRKGVRFHTCGPHREYRLMFSPLRFLTAMIEVLGQGKSFRGNPIIGSTRLNMVGLHKQRVGLAARLTSFRRRRLAERLDSADLAAFAQDGLIIKEDYLPKEIFERLRSEVFQARLSAREMRQGQTVTRMSSPNAAGITTHDAVVRRRQINDLMSYAAGRAGAPFIYLQTVIADPSISEPDPQTEFHADTFHSTAKLWFFLTDVGEEDGPLVYVPGSHVLTSKRLEWEYRQSLSARSDERVHHADGSFRIAADGLRNLGYGNPKPVICPANTLVIADTHGFHRRAPSFRPTTRVEFFGYLRRNPFVPWNGLDLLSCPGLKSRKVELFFRYLSFRERYLGKHGPWADVGTVKVNGPANV